MILIQIYRITVFAYDHGKRKRLGKPFSYPTEATYPCDGVDFKFTTNATMVQMAAPTFARLQHNLTLKAHSFDQFDSIEINNFNKYM